MNTTKAEEIRFLFQQEGLTPRLISLFRREIWRYYRKHGRTFPWRETSNPYHILVSEVMLQQTQTSRVVKKYEEFLAFFPDFFSLANAHLKEVLRLWQGLGYNRRALALQQTAQQVVTRFRGLLPDDPVVLRKLPGIGQYTASALAAIAFNKPEAFIDTNIRTVFLYCFFDSAENVSDRTILPLVEATLNSKNPREWYFALFDYGAMLKRRRITIPGNSLRKQGPFRGSNRELRGRIVSLLINRDSVSVQELSSLVDKESDDIVQILTRMETEDILEIRDGLVRIR